MRRRNYKKALKEIVEANIMVTEYTNGTGELRREVRCLACGSACEGPAELNWEGHAGRCPVGHAQQALAKPVED